MTAAVLLAVLLATVVQSGPALALSVASIPALVVLSIVKGTSPGGPAAWRQFHRVRAGELDAAEVEAEPAMLSATTRVVLALSGVLVAAAVVFLLLGTVASSAIAPPTSAHVRDGRLTVDVRGPYALFAVRGSVSVPLSSITSARYDPRARDLPRGSRFGTYVPGGLIAGSFGHGQTRSFWALQHEGALVISVNDESFATLVVEVRHPDAVLRALADAGVTTAR